MAYKEILLVAQGTQPLQYTNHSDSLTLNLVHSKNHLENSTSQYCHTLVGTHKMHMPLKHILCKGIHLILR